MAAGGFTARERRILAAVAEAALPSGYGLPGGGAETADRLSEFVASSDPQLLRVLRGLVWAVQYASVPTRGRSFSRLSADRRERLLGRWCDARFPLGFAVRQLVGALRVAHFSSDAAHARIGSRYAPEPVTEGREPPWLRQVRRLADEPAALELPAEVVVVGTGAGGAVVARELAGRGFAVVMVEEGDYVRRPDLAQPAMRKVGRLYRGGGLTAALGRPPVALQTGIGVGGTTLINSGTCYRVPREVLREWRDGLGATELTPEELDPHYRRVEAVLGVAPTPDELLSGVARAVARGAEALGYRHGPVGRNAPGCDKQAHCAYGCPSDAKRSTNVSYVPAALRDAAVLVTGARVHRVLLEAGRAVGVAATAADASGRRMTVRADAVVVAAGTLQTPVLLQASGLRGRALGRNLTLHPAAVVVAELEEEVAGWDGVPQSYAIEEFRDEGLLMEDGFPRLELAPLMLPFGGRRFMELMARFDHLGVFGSMVADTGRGRVRPGPRPDLPIVTYALHRDDQAKLCRAREILARVFFAAGARRVFPGVPGLEPLLGPEELPRLRDARFSAADLDVIGFHPLGTARLGADPTRSVVRPDLRCHDVRGLWVADGSAVPGPLGVNPQLTIMALATRAAGAIADSLA